MSGSDVAELFLAKLRKFVETDLNEQERELFAGLVAPGIARAHATSEVDGFGLTGWAPADLPAELSRALKRNEVGVEGHGLDL